MYVYIYAGSSPRSKEGSATLDAYLSQKHDKLLAKLLQPDSYRKRSSLAIVDGFAVEITEDQVMSAPFNTLGECMGVSKLALILQSIMDPLHLHSLISHVCVCELIITS